MKKLNDSLSTKELIIMWLPLLVSCVFTQMYGVVNTYISSKYISSDAVAVMASVSPYKSLQSYIFNGMTLGFGLVVCRTFEKRIYEKYKKTLKIGLMLVAVLCVLALVAIIFRESLMSLCNVPTDMRNDAGDYLLFLFIGSAVLALKNFLFTIINGMGEMKVVGSISIIGVILNSLLVYILIGVCGAGVWGVSLAVLISDILITLFMIIVFTLKSKVYVEQCVSESIENDKFSEKSLLLEMLRSGLAKPIMMGFVAVGAFFFQIAINNFSKEVISGLAYADTITNIFMAPLSALASLATAIGAQHVSAWNHRDESFIVIKNKIKIISIIVSVLSILVVWLFAPRLIILLGGSEQGGALIMAGTWKLRISLLGFPLLGYYLINRAYMHAMGKNNYMPILGILEMIVAVIGGVFIIPRAGFMSVGFLILVKWVIPGVFSEFIMKKHVYNSGITK